VATPKAITPTANVFTTCQKEPEMERNVEELELVDLGDAKELTQGDHTKVLEEDSGGMIYRP
jgi:hypothetical protein